MERPQTKNLGSKDDSSEEEGDFESADEGEENESLRGSFSATSSGADDEKNSTSCSGTQQVRRDTVEAMETLCETSFLENSGKAEEGEASLESKQKEEREKDGTFSKNEGNSPSSGREPDITTSDNQSKLEMADSVTESKTAADDVIQNKKNSYTSGENEACAERIAEMDKPSPQSCTNEASTTTTERQGEDDEKSVDRSIDLDHSAQEDKVSVDGSTSSDNKSPQATTSNEQPATGEQTSGGWGWGGWGSLLSQATSTVTTGLSSVIETVETSLGVPDPEEMAQKVRDDEHKAQELTQSDQSEDQDKQKGSVDDSGSTNSLFSSLGVASLTSMVESKGMDLVTGGLEALEFIGKKTMDVITDGDQGLRRKRQLLSGKGESLSQILRLAKEESEEKALKVGADESLSPMISYSTEFDQYQGLAHLEALEILSRQSSVKLESQMIDMEQESLVVAKPVLRAIEEIFQISDEEVEEEEATEADFPSLVSQSLEELNLGCVPDKLHHVQKKAKEWIRECVKEQDESPGSKTPSSIYSVAISTLAEMTARAIEQFHKSAELILLMNRTETSALVRAQSLGKLTETIHKELSYTSTGFAGCLNTAADDAENPETVSPLITSVYLESANSVSYVTNAFKLLQPVLQVSSVDEIQATAR